MSGMTSGGAPTQRPWTQDPTGSHHQLDPARNGIPFFQLSLPGGVAGEGMEEVAAVVVAETAEGQYVSGSCAAEFLECC